MRMHLIAAGIAAFAAAASAQPAAELNADPNAAPQEAPPPPMTREERLDSLFDRLAAAEEGEGDQIAGEITSLWARSGSESMDLLLNRARKATDAEAYGRARAHLAALIRQAPGFAEGWNASATLHFIQEDYWSAMEHIQRALALEPRHFGALSGLALILEHVDRKPAALDAWREVARLFPGMERAQEAIERLEKDVDGKEI